MLLIKVTVVIIKRYLCYYLHILASKLTPYVAEIIGDHLSKFEGNRSITDQIFCIRRTLEMKWEHNGTVHQLFIDYEKACDSVRGKYFTISSVNMAYLWNYMG
jgi:hypothetical protein